MLMFSSMESKALRFSASHPDVLGDQVVTLRNGRVGRGSLIYLP